MVLAEQVPNPALLLIQQAMSVSTRKFAEQLVSVWLAALVAQSQCKQAGYAVVINTLMASS